MPTPTEQLLSRTVYATDGTTLNWDFSFSGGYLLPAHVKAFTEVPATGERVELVVTEPMLIGPYQLRISPALASGLNLTIYRDTPKDLPLVDFTDESGFSEVSLDTNAKQAVFIAAETTDTVNTSSSYDAEQSASQAAASAASALASQVTASAAAASAAASAATLVLPLAVVAGGTGSTTAASARTALGAASAGPLAASGITGAAVAGPLGASGITGAAVAGPLGASGITGAAASGANTDITSLLGTATNDSAGAGRVGEYLQSEIAEGSAVAATTSVVLTVTTLALTAGDWDVQAVAVAQNTGAPSVFISHLDTSATSYTLPNGGGTAFESTTKGSTVTWQQSMRRRFSLSAPATIYLRSREDFTGTASIYGGIYARRVR